MVPLNSAGNTCFSEDGFGIWRSELGRWFPQRPEEVPLLAPLSQISRILGTNSPGRGGNGRRSRASEKRGLSVSCLLVALREALVRSLRKTWEQGTWGPAAATRSATGPPVPQLSRVTGHPDGQHAHSVLLTEASALEPSHTAATRSATNKGSSKRAIGVVKAPENRSQGNWLKEWRQFCLELGTYPPPPLFFFS